MPSVDRNGTMYLIVGLGNPSAKYEHTRHNTGFDCVDVIAKNAQIRINRSMHQAHFGKGLMRGQKVILAKPQTYMNLSGHAVENLIRFYKISPEHLIVIYDDTDLPPGKIRIRKKGSPGGHNGIKDVIRMTGLTEFNRIRIGVGNCPEHQEMVDYVLGRPQQDERELIDEGLEKAAKAAADIIEHGTDYAMNRYNG